MQKKQINIQFRNHFHFSAPWGWINDPNGFSYFNGLYHLFYQYNPESSQWGPMHWGHAVSTDLIKWEHLPIALKPDQEYDMDGCFSGTAIEHEGQHVLMYTGHVHPAEKDRSEAVQVQCLAIGDGVQYRKNHANPVIGKNQLPSDCLIQDFRDPKIWKKGASWYCLVAARGISGFGRLLLFTSLDLLNWQYIGVTLEHFGNLGDMWECPDYFRVNNQDVLIWSAMSLPRQKMQFKNRDSVVYSLGSLDIDTGRFTGNAPRELDSGPDFYASQTVATPDGRIVLIAWMQMWERSIPVDELNHGWAGSMTVARTIEVRDGTLFQWPLAELEAYRKNHRVYHALLHGARTFERLSGQCLDICLKLTIPADAIFEFFFYQGNEEQTVLRYTEKDNLLTMDRTLGGVPIRSTSSVSPECQIYQTEVPLKDSVLDIRILLDRSAFEVFAQQGAYVLSTTVYPKDTSTGISFNCLNGKIDLKCEVWDLLIE